MDFSVTKNGIGLEENNYQWDEKTKTFSSHVYGLVLDFTNINGVTFKTGSDCTFDTGSDCTFDTYSNCTFKTGSDCTFDTCSDCTFDTGSNCTFKTSFDCTFDTDYGCKFKTGDNCTFETGDDCTFETGDDCTFKTGENCFVTRYDVKGVTEIPVDKTIKLNGCKIQGYTIIKEKTETSCEGKIVEIDGKKYQLKEID